MGALDGLLVITIEQAVAAPMCTVRLADAGARVIKVEREGGETARHYDKAVQGTSAYFAWLNRGKESAVLDLKSPQDLALFKAMLSKADVLVQNLRPGALIRMGLSDEVLEKDFPKLISVSIVGYGQDTPYADMRAYDLLVQAESGLCAVTGSADAPAKIGVSAADIATGMNAHAAILEALIERGRTGRGKQIEISMFDGMADWMSVPLLHFEHQGKVTQRFGLSHATIYPYGPFACSNGTIIVAVQTNAEWERLCDVVLARPELKANEQFASNANRVRNRDLVDAEVNAALARLTVNEAVDRLRQAGVAYANFTEAKDLAQHPALRRTIVSLPDDTKITMPRPAGRTTDFATAKVPALGEHTDKVKAEFTDG